MTTSAENTVQESGVFWVADVVGKVRLDVDWWPRRTAPLRLHLGRFVPLGVLDEVAREDRSEVALFPVLEAPVVVQGLQRRPVVVDKVVEQVDLTVVEGLGAGVAGVDGFADGRGPITDAQRAGRRDVQLAAAGPRSTG